MAKNIVINAGRKGQYTQFKVGYMSYPGLNQNKAFKEQVETFDKIIIVPIIKVSKKENTCVLSLVMFYDKIRIFFPNF